ncbi:MULTISPECIES: glycine zipper 2TM domain-containing protein [Microvirgula]|uniref:Glycine zipper 2TM domain-containing protein n=1 Tax=Microvirgula aerodenitrificans TaxID=57480 RepID=A0A2S0PE78_9NEIS|nr:MULTISPECIES: glycine zipper 2TM domain-containing protein [Microvirgula]AVY95567.1 glycine zipper 2TM domain-containing protein [Microvirgula aerodenitrificans]RAS13767.1 outer membrane lipoprotein SlyB [Microvirgula sp. AG722]
MLNTFVKPALVATVAALTLAGCASNSASLYTTSQAQRVQTVELGTVVSVQNARIQGDNNPLYTLGGAALGGLAGSNVGKGTGAAAGAIVGALLGGAATNAAQKNMGGQAAYEITVQLDTGRTISIVQQADTPISSGMRVRVLSGGGADRVVPL